MFYDEETGEDQSIIRYEEQIDLLRIRSEVLVSAPPNYLKNPGLRYRITISGIAVAPDYNKVFEVNAGDALAAVFNEIDKIYNSTHGVYRTGIYYGAVIAMRVLNQTAHLPAEIPIGTMRSRAAQIRIEDEYLTRRAQPRLERFPTEAGSMEFSRVLGSELTGPTEPTQRSATRPTATAITTGPVRGQSYRAHTLGREEHRASQLQSIGDQKSAKNPLGQAGRPVNVPEHDYPAISASQIESLDLLLGDTRSPMEMRTQTQSPQRPVAGVSRAGGGR